jgi:hypothetical protein
VRVGAGRAQPDRIKAEVAKHAHFEEYHAARYGSTELEAGNSSRSQGTAGYIQGRLAGLAEPSGQSVRPLYTRPGQDGVAASPIESTGGRSESSG